MLGRVTSAISAILVDDEQLACDELAYLLKKFDDIEIASTALNGIEAVKLIEQLEPDVVFIDVQMPGMGGLDVIRELRERGVPLPYFILVNRL